MKQKTINQNKLQTLLCIIALTFGVLVSAVLFSMIPVHAAEANSFVLNTFKGDYKYSYSNTNTASNNYRECVTGYLHFTDKKFYAFVYDTETNASFGMFRLFYYDPGSGKVKVYQNDTKSSYNFPSGFKDESAYFNIYYIDQESTKAWAHYYICSFYIQSYNTDPEFSSDLMIFNSESSMLSYCQLGDKSGLITPGAPDLTDDSYTYTGFSINGKIARWTGTTERSHLKDQEVEEYTRITYGFATSEDQTLNDDNFIEYDQDFAVGEKQMTIPLSEIESNKKDGEFIRQVNFIPCYRVPGAFYLGKGVKVFYKSDGSIDKIEYAQKQTDLNTGNMIFDSSIGYLQNVIYTEEKTHDGKGRQATFKWSTSKALPHDAQVEIVAQNFYIEWFNKKTEENFIYKEYGEDCIYKNGSFSFNANTPVWTWLNEKEIDPFSVKTQSYGTKEYYLRIVTYNEKDSMYHYGGWVRVNVKSKDATNMPTTDVETGGFDDDSGLWNKDSDSDDSYHYSTDDKGDLTGNISVSDWEDLNINSFTWMYRNLQSMVQSLGQLPTMVSTIFGFLPNQVITALSVLLIAVVLMRFLGR